MTKRAAIYTRVSSVEQAKGFSLFAQIDDCSQYAIERGYQIVDTFLEDYSGAVLDRPELNRLRVAIGNRRIDVVIVYEIDRLARKSAYQALIEEEFSRYGVTVEYVIGQYDDSDEGRLQKQIRASIAEYEKAKIIERSRRGLRAKAKSGFVIVGSRPPYGYKVVSEPHKAWLVIDEAEAEVVKMIFQWYLNGDENGQPLSLKQILRKINSRHIPTCGDKQKHVLKTSSFGIWSGIMINHILKNETYAGIWHYGKTKVVHDGMQSSKQKKQKPRFGKPVPSPRDEWIAVPVPAIISTDDFKKVQMKLAANIELANSRSKPEYLMARRLHCAKCGFTCVGRSRNGNPFYYRCNAAQRDLKICDMPYFRMDEVDNVIWKWLSNIFMNPENLAISLKGFQEDIVRSNQALFDRLAILEKRIMLTEKQIEKMLDLCISNIFPIEQLQERKSRLDETLARLQWEQTDITANLETIILSDDQIADITAFFNQIQQDPEMDTLAKKRQVIDVLDVQSTLGVEDCEKVVYLKCLIGQQRLSVV